MSGLRVVVRLVSGVHTVTAATMCEEELRSWPAEEWHRLFLELPWDAYTFLGEFELPWGTVIDDLRHWCGQFPDRPDSARRRYRSVFGNLGLLLLTLVSLRHSYERRYGLAGAADARPPHDCAVVCQPLMCEPAVREALVALYAPGTPLDAVGVAGHAADPLTQAEWNRMDVDSLRFHRHGTTSFILSGRSATTVHGRRRSLALKCITYPYLRVPAIVRNTRRYRETYSVPDTEARHLARVWASEARWIMMDLVPGETLAEYLQRQVRPHAPPGDIRVDLLALLGRELFDALADLEDAGLRHCDLSPSNIIVRSGPSGELSFVLVDLGVNYLYAHEVPGSDGPDAAYVAPEVRTDATQNDRADLYSAGRLLIAIAGVPDEPDSTVPDAFYAETPMLARFLEDLTGRDPDNRLVIFRPEGPRGRYRQLLHFLEEELQAVEAARAQRPATDKRWLATLLDLRTPLADAPGRQRRLWEVRRAQSLYADPERGMHVRWLLAWSRVSAYAWYVAAFLAMTWWLRDLDWNWGNHLTTALQRAAGSSDDELPVLDGVRADDYPIPDLRGNLPIRMVGLSFLLAGVRFYQNTIAGITTRTTGRGLGRLSLLASLAEFSMRGFSLVPAVLVLPPTLVQRDWWPICTAIGILCIFLCNFTCLRFAREAVRQARRRGLSTVPSGRIAGLEVFSNWAPTSGFYCISASTIGTLIYVGLVQDVYVYAAAVTAINIVLFYVIKCSGSSAADVRVALSRACLAAERVRRVPTTGP
ncbi:hypothetical protein AQ490_07355 [Wenjunlia vitaminophila]|uniref:Protein kinase domain-containing protein n=1 Tax=Wenjunlia vitaminophila TaxID=76728 RepID=A0A0T6LN34_WENVI|nr:hypothetical protein [Wenjunlia vitaminophila]KRV47282.1 hypothetical protein AQ490_07355 [Wenjunlia vitaminophila]